AAHAEAAVPEAVFQADEDEPAVVGRVPLDVHHRLLLLEAPVPSAVLELLRRRRRNARHRRRGDDGKRDADQGCSHLPPSAARIWRVFSASSVASFSSSDSYFAGSMPLFSSFSDSICRSICERSAYSARSFSSVGTACGFSDPMARTAADAPSFPSRDGSMLPSLSPLSSRIECSVGSSPSR